MSPLKEEYPVTYTHGDRTFYGAKHRGIDYLTPVGTPVHAPFEGKVEYINGVAGGKMIYFHTEDYVIRFLHLESIVREGQVREGQIIAYTGNTGLSTAPHLHLDISNKPFKLLKFSNFIDPLTFSWETDDVDKAERQKYEQRIAEEVALKQEYYDNWQKELDYRKKEQESAKDASEKSANCAVERDVIREKLRQVKKIVT